ncbi:ABC transporter permease [Achromobacter ruhlandii]|uniref:Putrescine transport system permease protein PotH n=1 Tax=Achromobacter ruhlandii TaxID=72557 RepID=A0ABM8LX54_9BURK|nr:ABC transporter permease [Achromobacter ruhlandii]AKP91972.1 Spermidine Putrescine ABC transporter permease component PotB [Achromobacter xylosoxidans]AOU95208.1 POPT family ABC-type transporter permease [Achromobacter ruhlandii]MCV6795160.1 ABC transporter permease [Achromobacter ruhlandii]MCV6802021.1 ABC transporter permease [Achromobacter ruhlandii]MCV6807001.1 ABC transporter permease [Achromobacter ruhlandii]
MNTRSGLRGWLISPAGLIALCIVVAMAAVLQFSVRAFIPGSMEVGGLTLANFSGLGKSIYLSAFLNTLLLSIETTVCSLLVAYPLAYALVRVRRRLLKSCILIISITPLFLGEIVRTYSWIIVLGNNGFLNTLLRQLGLIEQPLNLMFTHLGVLIALVHVTIPVVVLMLATAISHIDRDYEKAAQSLGAGPVRTFLTVTLPLSMPGIIASITTAFAWTFSAFATPQMIGGGRVPTVSTLVYQLGFSSMNFPLAASLSISGLALTVAALLLLGRATKRLKAIGAH